MQRTIKLKLILTPLQRQFLFDTLTSYTRTFNFVTNFGWQERISNSTKLHRATYQPLRAQSGLPAQLVCSARNKAAEALKSAFALQKLYPPTLAKWQVAKAKALAKGKIFRRRIPQPPSCPTSTLCPIRYDARSYWVKWGSSSASLVTLQGRLIIPFSLPPYFHQYTQYPVNSADLIYRQGKFYLHVSVTLPEVEYQASGEVVGIDLGISRPAVTSTCLFLGKRRWREVVNRTFRLRRALQSKGTKSAKRHLKRLSGRIARFKRDCDHVISKRIVQNMLPGATIVIEDLTNIRERVEKGTAESRRRFHSWSFAQLRRFLAYKAEMRGIMVVAVEPAFTSQTCSKCGYIDRHNRKSQSHFQCGVCGYSLNADLNASYNIRDRGGVLPAEEFLAGLGKALPGGLPVNQPFVSSENSGTSRPATAGGY